MQVSPVMMFHCSLKPIMQLSTFSFISISTFSSHLIVKKPWMILETYLLLTLHYAIWYVDYKDSIRTFYVFLMCTALQCHLIIIFDVILSLTHANWTFCFVMPWTIFSAVQISFYDYILCLVKILSFWRNQQAVLLKRYASFCMSYKHTHACLSIACGKM